MKVEINEKAVPEVGKKYNCYDDGKVRPSRHYITEIIEVIPFRKCTDKKLINNIKKEIKKCDHLYCEETDYIIVGKSVEENEREYFIRTKDGGWFSIGFIFNSGRLDIDHSLTDYLLNNRSDFIYTDAEWNEWLKEVV